ncbi:aldolase/citrate lyase family protein [Pseudomonas sp. R2.Fl]|nr:aldolase/citrate lyase family protein [Pseudomonas sp. R2.Fl]
MPALTDAFRDGAVRAWLRFSALLPAADLPSDVSAGEGLVIDLGDLGDRLHGAADIAARWRQSGGGAVLARMRPLTLGEHVSEDITAAVTAGAIGIVLPGIRSGADLQHLHSLIAVEEAIAGTGIGTMAIVAEIGDVAQGVLQAASLAGKTPRLTALFFDPQALAGHMEAGPDTAVVATGRGLALLGARAADIAAYETLPSPINEAECLDRCQFLRAEGFHGAVTDQPELLGTIRTVFRDRG